MPEPQVLLGPAALNQPGHVPRSPWARLFVRQRRGYQQIADMSAEQWTELHRPQNMALAISYFLVGYLPSFISTPLSVYMVRTINAHPSVQNSVYVAISVPWSLKLLYGFLSDAVPIGGERRRPYIFLGFALCSASYLMLSSIDRPCAATLALTLFIATFGMVMADTTCDSMVVERARCETEDRAGHLQGTCYALRFGGSMVGAILGAVVYNRRYWGWGLTFQEVTFLSALAPLVAVMPMLPSLREIPREGDLVPVSQQLKNIWDMVQLKAVWRPMLFVYTYNFFQVSNVAWGSYLQLTLHFSPWILGSLNIAGSAMTFLGIVCYKRFFKRSSWRSVYICSTLLTAVFSVLQLLLIFQVNTRYLHMSNYLFALGDDAVTSLLSGIQFLPVCLMYAKLCPDGSEGATYAMLTTLGNIGLICSNSVSSVLAQIWDVSNMMLRRGNVSGLWRLSLLTSCLSPLPLLLMRLLPGDFAEQKSLQASKKTSPVAGFLFLGTLFLSLAWILSQAAYTLLYQ